MKKIYVHDSTIKDIDAIQNISFRDKLDTIKFLDLVGCDVIELPYATTKTNHMLIKSILPYIKKSSISVDVDFDLNSVDCAIDSLGNFENKILNIIVPLSDVSMEYVKGIKPKNLIEKLESIINYCFKYCNNVSVTFLDVLRSDIDMLINIYETAKNLGVRDFTIWDVVGNVQPVKFLDFISAIKKHIVNDVNNNFCIRSSNYLGFSLSNVFLALQNSFNAVNTSIIGDRATNLFTFVKSLSEIGSEIDFKSDINISNLEMSMDQMFWFDFSNHLKLSNKSSKNKIKLPENNEILLDESADEDTVIKAVKDLGYDLTEHNNNKIFKEFKRISSKKSVGFQEIDAIVASTATDIPSTYKLVDFVINTSNLFPAIATVTLEKDGQQLRGNSTGHGPIDAVIKAVEMITKQHFELDDFQVQNVTKTSDAVGVAIIKLRHEGKLYSGKGASTDIVSASLRAYLHALNNLLYKGKNN